MCVCVCVYVCVCVQCVCVLLLTVTLHHHCPSTITTPSTSPYTAHHSLHYHHPLYITLHRTSLPPLSPPPLHHPTPHITPSTITTPSTSPYTSHHSLHYHHPLYTAHYAFFTHLSGCVQNVQSNSFSINVCFNSIGILCW